MLKLFLIILANFYLINCDNQYIEQMNNISSKTYLHTYNYLLYSSATSIYFVYPKELGYKNDYLKQIYEICYFYDKCKYTIGDSVFDNKTSSIYFSVSNTLINGGTYLIRLRDVNSLDDYYKFKILSNQPDNFEFKFRHADFWSKTVIYHNSKSTITSLDIDVKKRKLYWLEKTISNWSFASKNLNDLNEPPKYYTFNSKEFSMEIYSSISVAHDNGNDIAVFVSNRKTFGICYSVSMKCINYFKSSSYSKLLQKNNQANLKDHNGYKEKSLESEFSLNLIEKKIEDTQVMNISGLVYDKIEHVLYFSDQESDRILKVYFEKTIRSAYVFLKIEEILKVEDYESGRIRSHTQLVFNGFLFWIDFDGIKIGVKNSTCPRSIYKIRNSCSLKLVQTS